jgi:hypothetical protein
VSTDGNGNASATIAVTANSSTTFTAKAADAFGNTSTLSNSLVYIHDNNAPTPPIITSSIPLSPSRSSTTPTLSFTGEVGSTIRIYAGSSCTGSVLASGVVPSGGVVAIQVSVSANSTNIFTATATDAAGNVSACSSTFSYTHDATAPSTPVFTSVTPASPSNASTTPSIVLTGEVGSTIRIYAGSSCAGSVLASGVVSSGGVVAIQVSVSANSTNVFTATATDAAGNVSVCSSTFTYTHDNVAPTTPNITSSSPASPGSSLTPTLNVIGEAGSTLRIFNNATGTGLPVTTVTIPSGGLASVVVTVTAGSTTSFTARLTDAAGNVSVLSIPFIYTHTP